MTYEQNTCSQCGAPLTVGAEMGSFVCEYCGTIFLPHCPPAPWPLRSAVFRKEAQATDFEHKCLQKLRSELQRVEQAWVYFRLQHSIPAGPAGETVNMKREVDSSWAVLLITFLTTVFVVLSNSAYFPILIILFTILICFSLSHRVAKSQKTKSAHRWFLQRRRQLEEEISLLESNLDTLIQNDPGTVNEVHT